jgi:putative peptidoglycan lipid II flippase
VTRAFYALKDTVTPVRIAAVSFVINVGLSWYLKNTLGAAGLVIASTIAVIAQTFALQRLLAVRIPGMGFGGLWRTIGKILAASLIMSAAVAGGWILVQRLVSGHRAGDLLAIGLLIPVSVLMYAGALWLLRVEGREELAAMVRRRLGRADRKS